MFRPMRRAAARHSGPLIVRFRIRSSSMTTSSTQWRQFSIFQWLRVSSSSRSGGISALMVQVRTDRSCRPFRPDLSFRSRTVSIVPTVLRPGQPLSAVAVCSANPEASRHRARPSRCVPRCARTRRQHPQYKAFPSALPDRSSAEHAPLTETRPPDPSPSERHGAVQRRCRPRSPPDTQILENPHQRYALVLRNR